MHHFPNLFRHSFPFSYIVFIRRLSRLYLYPWKNFSAPRQVNGVSLITSELFFRNKAVHKLPAGKNLVMVKVR